MLKRDLVTLLATFVIIMAFVRLHYWSNIEFSPDETLQMKAGYAVYKSWPIPIMPPQEMFPFITTGSCYLVDKYALNSAGQIAKIGDAAEYPPSSINWQLTIFWLYLPIMMLFYIAKTSTQLVKRATSGFMVFSGANLAAIALAMMTGIILINYFGILVGGTGGTLVGVYLGLVVGRLTPGGPARTWVAVLTAGLSGGLAGATGYNPAYWHYVIIYAIASCLAFIYQQWLITRRTETSLSF